MLFHITMTHTVEDCPGYNREKMPEVMAAFEKREALAKELNIKCHFWVQGAPEHVAFALIEADNPAALTRFVTSTFPIRQDFKMTLVHSQEELEALGKAMMEQR